MQEKGQTLLIVVLVMVVSLTIGLSVVSRSITNLKISTEEESSQKAFSAAEAGVEQAIKVGCVRTESGCASIANSFGEDSSPFKTSFNTSISEVSGAEFLVNGGNPIEADEGINVWLIPHVKDSNNNFIPDYSQTWNGNLSFYWGNSNLSDCQNAALEVILILGSKANPKSKREVFDPCAERRNINNFSNVSNGGASGYAYKQSININPNPPNGPGLIARIIPFYQSAIIKVSANKTLPVQGNKIESTGTSGSTNRKIILYQGFKELPSEYFPYVLFSPKQK